jgi:RNA polymerase sigma-70 factor (ECF subfamily)
MAIRDMQPALGSLDDAVVIADSRERPEAFHILFDRHYERVRRYARARIGAGGEDVAAEVFAIAFAGRDRYDLTRPDAVPWLLGIATNLIRRQHREEHRRLRLLAALGGERPSDATAETVDPAVAAAIGRLHRRDRDVLLLFAIAELSYAEIAQALGIAEGTVRSRLHRARRIVKEVMPR